MEPVEILKEALKKTGLPVKHYEYDGTKQEYIVYNEEAEQPINYADNAPQNRITWWQVHIFTPKESDFRGYKKTAEKNLREAGFSVTDIRTLYEKETKTMHVAISCHIGEKEE